MSVTEPALRRQLGVFSAAAVLIGSTIGSGIFRVPGTVAAAVGSVGGIVAVWCTGAVIALCGALALSTLAVRYPHSGGIYVFLRERYGPMAAFLFGWTQLVVIRPAALGAIALICAAYAGGLAGLGDGGVRLLAACIIAVVGLANVRSVRLGAWVANLTTVAKVLALVLLSAAAFVLVPSATAADPTPVIVPAAGFGAALIAVMWAYDGWADLTFMAGEVRDPVRVLPRALIGGTAVVVLVYLLVNAAYLRALPVAAMAGSSMVAADAAVALVGRAGAALVSGLVVLSTFGSLNGVMMTGPRIFYAMAADGLFFRPVAAVHPRWSTPWVSITLASGLGVAYVSARTFEQLADAFVLGIWPFYVLAIGAVFSSPSTVAPTVRCASRAAAVVFLAGSLVMLGDSAVHRPGSTLAAATVILAGVPVYLTTVGRRRAGDTMLGNPERP